MNYVTSGLVAGRKKRNTFEKKTYVRFELKRYGKNIDGVEDEDQKGRSENYRQEKGEKSEKSSQAELREQKKEDLEKIKRDEKKDSKKERRFGGSQRG